MRLDTLIVSALLTLLMSVVASPVFAHSWYDPACCSDRDCRPVASGEVLLQANGWHVIPTGELILFDDPRIRQSRDPLMHICTTVAGTIVTRCLYVPLGS